MASQKPVFKTYSQNQILLLPPSLDELIGKDHPVRIVNEVINSVDIQSLVGAYASKGTSSYHPQMLLKVLIYGYMNNIYSSRKLEAACKENVHFMWLSAMNYPDHNTINRFRSDRLKHSLHQIFKQIVLLFVEQGLLSIDEVFTDGTKIEANANKYTFVWKKAIQTSKERIGKQLTEILHYAQSIAKAEDELPPPPDFTNINKEQVETTINTLNKVLADNPDASKKIKNKLRYAEKEFPAKLQKYEQQEQILGERNSYSKTDKDATFMRMKEDHMQNGQLKPGYNLQISTSNQFIVNYSLHANPTDTTTLKAHLQKHQETYDTLPKSLTADAGYGSEENYQLLESNGIEAYVKFNMFDKQQSQRYHKKNTFTTENLFYNPEKDCFICPMGQPMDFIGISKRVTSTGFEQNIRRYQAKNCFDCPLNGACHKSKRNRVIEVNPKLAAYKQKATELLNSEEGVKKRKKRCFDTEPVFGNIKQNHHFKRFMLRGTQKVTIECGLMAIAQNMRKRTA